MSLNESEQTKLEIESARGEDWERVYEAYLAPFFEKKQDELFEAFKEIPTSAKDRLMLIKMQCNALQSLEDEFKAIIKTGQLARITLNEEKNNG